MLLAVVLLAVGPLRAQQGDGCPKLGLVLSGGGAKGAAHIGVLKYMEEIGLPVSYVTGTSMGSIIGGLYALGYTPEELETLISNIDWPMYIVGKNERRNLSQRRREMSDRLLVQVPYGKFMTENDMQVSAMPMGAVEGDNLVNLFNFLSVGYQDSMCFDSMPIPFACVATDLMTGKPIVLRDGEFAQSLRSSMAIPIFFTPVQRGNKMLADGGITNNFPVDICLEMGADVVVGLEVASDIDCTPDELRSIPRQLQQYLSIVTNRGLDEHRKQCRIYINPDVSGINMLSFNAEAIAELVRRGYEAAKAHEADFLQLKAELCDSHPLRGEAGVGGANGLPRPPARTLLEPDSLVVDDVVFTGMDPRESSYLRRVAGRIQGVKVTRKQIEDVVHVMQGAGRYHSVNVKTTLLSTDTIKDDDHYHIEFIVTPELSNRIGVGLRYDSEESATLLLHASWNRLKLSGFNASVDLALRYNYWLQGHVGWLIPGIGDLGLDVRIHNAVFSCHNRPTTAMDLRERQIRLGITTVNIPQREISMGLLQDINTEKPTADNVSGNKHTFATGVYFSLNADTKDEKAFATDGYLLKIDAKLRKPTELLFDQEEPIVGDVAFSIKGYISATNRLTFIPALYTRWMWGYDGDALWYNNIAGGTMAGRYLTHQMPFVGMTGTIETGPLAFLYSLETRYRVGKKIFLSLHANMLASSTRDEIRNIGTDGYVAAHYLGVAASVGYSSLLGPVSLLVGTNSYNRNLQVYLSVGFDF